MSYFTKARDYDGVFDFVPRAARPKVGRPPFGIGVHRNFDIGAGQGRLHVINDNAGRLFHLSQEPGPAAPWSTWAQPTQRRKSMQHRSAAAPARP